MVNEIINYVFSATFLFELIIKLVAYGKPFFYDGWNNFDAFIVFGSLVGVLLSKVGSIDVGASTLVLRAFRICRMLKLFKSFRSLTLIF